MKKCKILFVLLVLRTYFEFLLLHPKPYKELFNLYSVKTNIVQLLLRRSGKFNTKKKQISKMTDLCPFTGLAENVTNQSVNQIYHISHLPHDLHYGSVLVMNQR